VAESLPYASPRPPRRSESAIVAAWCASIGVPPPVVFALLFRGLNVPPPRWLEPFVPMIVLLSMAAMMAGVVCAANAIAQREPRWRLAAVAGVACAGTLAWVAFLFVTR
jgi:hypothetical protein